MIGFQPTIRTVWVASLLVLSLGIPIRCAEPPVLLHGSPPGKAILTLPGGDLGILYMVSGQHCASIRSSDGGMTWSEPRIEFEFRKPAGVPVVLVDREGELHAFMLVLRGSGWTPTVDYFYESFSPDGVEWSEARPTRFRSSNSPANLLRLPDGRLVVFWNNCENPSRVDGEPVYTTRDALHVAISPDDGRTWKGYREAFRDPNRNQPPPRRGDRGTAYPFSTATRDGQVILAAGQGQGRIALVRIDPEWIGATSREDDFSSGLEGWNVFKPFGPADYYWRDRVPGPRLLDHPTREDAKALQVRRPDEKSGDEAVWNFSAGRRGGVSLRILLPEGFGGGVIALADRFIQPTEPAGERLEVFRLQLDAGGRIEDGPVLVKGRWHALRLSWDLDRDRCSVEVDGKPALVLPRLKYDSDPLSYLRLRSNAKSPDPAGMLIERVAAMRDE